MPAVGDSLPQSLALTQGFELLLPWFSGGLMVELPHYLQERYFIQHPWENIEQDFFPNSYNFSAVFWSAPRMFSYLGLLQLKSPLHLFFFFVLRDLSTPWWSHPSPCSSLREWGPKSEGAELRLEAHFSVAHDFLRLPLLSFPQPWILPTHHLEAVGWNISCLVYT